MGAPMEPIKDQRRDLAGGVIALFGGFAYAALVFTAAWQFLSPVSYAIFLLSIAAIFIFLLTILFKPIKTWSYSACLSATTSFISLTTLFYDRDVAEFWLTVGLFTFLIGTGITYATRYFMRRLGFWHPEQRQKRHA